MYALEKGRGKVGTGDVTHLVWWFKQGTLKSDCIRSGAKNRIKAFAVVNLSSDEYGVKSEAPEPESIVSELKNM